MELPLKNKAVSFYELMSPDVAQSWAEKVYSLESLWTPQGSDLSNPYYYTLGNPIYKHVENTELYIESNQQLNETLKTEFIQLYSLVNNFLEEKLKEPVKFLPELAVPGFHIYKDRMPEGGVIHQDRQHESLFEVLPDERWDLLSRLSVTLCLEVPKSGAGLNTWPDSISLSSIEGSAPVKYDYKPGYLYVIHTLMFHQIAPNSEMAPPEKRTTLQGHLLRNKKGFWVFYW